MNHHVCYAQIIRHPHKRSQEEHLNGVTEFTTVRIVRLRWAVLSIKELEQ